jgi:hypothetical protein
VCAAWAAGKNIDAAAIYDHPEMKAAIMEDFLLKH